MKRAVLFCSFLFAISMSVVYAAPDHVYIGGETIAIQGSYDGVVISGMYEFENNGEWINPITSSSLEVGDKIVYIENNSINCLDDMYQFLAENPKKDAIYDVVVLRNNSLVESQLNVYYLQDEKIFKTGLYVKDKIKGVGTVTFYNPVNKTYGALGHEIVDPDFGYPAEISTGDIFMASVSSISKSLPNQPGEKNSVNTLQRVGTVVKNTKYGVYGNYEYLSSSKQLIEIGERQYVKVGPATMYTVLSDQEIVEVEIHISQVNNQSAPDTKSFKFEITDQSVISQTGGIIQGMSGSPIVQDGKLIGAVTHMITSTPNNGYGLYIEWMLNEANLIN